MDNANREAPMTTLADLNREQDRIENRSKLVRGGSERLRLMGIEVRGGIWYECLELLDSEKIMTVAEMCDTYLRKLKYEKDAAKPVTPEEFAVIAEAGL